MAYFFILAGIILRLVPHVPNFAPITALALFGGTYLNRKSALGIPLLAMLISDIFIGFYDFRIMMAVYGSFLIIGLLGRWLKNHKNIFNLFWVTFSSSFLFFLITNFAVWAVPHSLYPHTWQGLSQSYIMGLPFLRNTLLGDFFYVATMFGLMEFVIKVTTTYQFKKRFKKERDVGFTRIQRGRI